MYFLSPLYLWALLGLAVPIAIHLWSKKEGKTLKIGSIQLIQEADSKQSSSIKLNEWWLLFLRLLILSLLVLIIAEPRLKQSEQNVPITYLIEASLLEYDEINKLIDTLDTSNSLRIFEKGFPDLDREQFDDLSDEIPNYWQLAKDLQELRSDSIVVFTNAFVSGLKGKRPSVKENIKWIFLDPSETEEVALKATKKGDEVKILKAISNSEALSFKTELVSLNDPRVINKASGDSIYLKNGNSSKGIPIEKEDVIKIELYFTDNFSETEFYLEAALKAISKFLDREIIVHKVENKDSLNLQKADAAIWLSDENYQESLLPMLIYKENKLSPSLIIPGDFKNEYILTTTLNSENSMEAHLAENLLEFLGLNKEYEKNIAKLDRRVMPLEQFLPNEGNTNQLIKETKALDISHWFWLFLIPIIITERLLSRFRNK